jgi:short-subunit dehydrogenase
MIAEGLQANGAIVYICSRKKDQCDKTCKELNEKYPQGKAISKPGDLSSIAGVEKLVTSLSEVEKLDVLVNNAGATWGAVSVVCHETSGSESTNILYG